MSGADAIALTSSTAIAIGFGPTMNQTLQRGVAQTAHSHGFRAFLVGREKHLLLICAIPFEVISGNN